MKKTLRKYQAGSLPSYTGMSTSPTYQIPTTPAPLPATLPRVTNVSPTTTGFSEQPKSNVGSTVAGAAMGVAGSVMSGISTANSAQANIDAAKWAKAKRDEAKRNIAAFKSENLSDPDAVREYTQMQNSTYNREDASLDVGRMQSEAQEEISKNTTIAATSAIPIVGPLVSGITALTWGLLGDAEEEQYQKQLANRRSSSPTSVGGTSEESRPDSMFAKYGGKMPTYQMGGSRSYQEPNAELEDGEVIMRNGGKNEMVEGDTHEEGGEDKYLAPGDFVWSDHLKYKGKSMAELYLMVKDSPEKVEQLKALQENLASKEKPSKYNDLPQKKYGGEVLPKYQVGSPNPSIVDYLNSKGIDSSFKNRKALSGISNYRGTAEQNQKLLKEYVDAEAAMNNSNTLAPTVTAPQSVASQLSNYSIPPVGTSSPQTLTTNLNVPTGKAGRAPGTYSKARTMLNKYGIYIPQLAGSLAQIGMLAGMSDPYKDLTVPKASLVGNHRFTPFGRLNNQAAEDQIREMYHAQLADARYRGAGPGDSSQGQKAYNQAIQGIAETQKGVMGANVNLAAQEANMNMEDARSREVFNAAAINAQKESENANQIASANFGVQKSGALAGAFGTMGTDISKSIADKEYALAIYGNTSMNADRYRINHKEVERLAKEAALKNAKAAGRSSATPQEELLQMVKFYDAMKTT